MTEWSGEDYADISALQRTIAQEAVASLRLTGTESVLDVGCGDGHITRRLAELVPDGYVVGADPSHGMLIEAARHDRVGPSGPSFVRADVRHLPVARHFDVAVSFNALHWVPQQEEALGQIESVVRPGGRVLIQMVCAGERPSLEDIAMTVCERPEWSGRFASFPAPFVHPDPEQYGSLAEAAGLTVAGLTVTDHQWDFGTRERFTQWCSVGSFAWTDRLGVGEATRFVDEMVRAYQEVAGRPGLFRFTQMRADLVRR